MTSSNWVVKAREIGPVLAAEASKHDLEGSFVAAAYATLKANQFFSLAVPGELGGGGASYEEVCDTVRELGNWCGSTALAFSMHTHLVAATVWRFRRGLPGEVLLRKIASEQTVLLSTGAGDWIPSNGTMKKVDGGFRVTARKAFGSGGAAADLIVGSSRYEDPKDGVQVLHFAVPMSAQGVSVESDWDTLGMRGSSSNTVVLDNVFVPDEAITLRRSPDEWHPAFSMVVTIAHPIFMSSYLGIAEAATKLALGVAKAGRNDPLMPYLAGELEIELTQARVTWRSLVDNAANYAFEPQLARANHALTCKTLLGRNCVATVQKAIQIAGGRAYFRSFGMERLFRDVLAGTFHPLNERKQQLFSGRIALGLEPINGKVVG